MAASRCSLSRHSQCFPPPCGRRAKPCPPHLCNIISLRHASLSSSCFPLTCSCSLKTLNFAPRTRTRRLGSAVPALVSEESATESASSSTESFKLTYLEVNSWLWEVGGVKLLVDPILVGTLDFGIPWLYDAAKKSLKNFQLSDLPEVDCLLITQSLDDHCHLKTLKPLSAKFPNLRVVATPNARAKLDPLFNKIYRFKLNLSEEWLTPTLKLHLKVNGPLNSKTALKIAISVLKLVSVHASSWVSLQKLLMEALHHERNHVGFIAAFPAGVKQCMRVNTGEN